MIIIMIIIIIIIITIIIIIIIIITTTENRQNKMFETNQRRLYQELNRENMSETVAPAAEQSKEF